MKELAPLWSFLTQARSAWWLFLEPAEVGSRTFCLLTMPQTTKPLGSILPTFPCGAVCQASLSFHPIMLQPWGMSFSESFLLKSPSAPGFMGPCRPSFLPVARLGKHTGVQTSYSSSRSGDSSLSNDVLCECGLVYVGRYVTLQLFYD